MASIPDASIWGVLVDVVWPALGHIGTFLAGVVSWLYLGLVKRLEALESSLKQVREELPANYVTQKRLSDDLHALRDSVAQVDRNVTHIYELLIQRNDKRDQ